MQTDMEYASYMLFEVGGIQQYVFESNRLRDIRGASALLDEVNRVMVQDIVDKPEFEGVTVIRSIGGVSLIGFEEKNDGLADELESQIKGLFARHIPGAILYTGRAENKGGSVYDQLSELTYRTSLKQGMEPGQDAQTALMSPMVHFCKSCGLRPAQHESRIVDTYELICRVCFAKQEYGQPARKGLNDQGPLGRFKSYVEEHKADWAPFVKDEVWQQIVPPDMDAIGAHANGEVGMILADGNRLGELLRRMSSIKRYKEFAENLGIKVQEAVFEVLAEHKPCDNGAGQTCLPWEIILLGGDDVLIVTAAHLVFDVATAIMKGVEDRTASVIEHAQLLPPEDANEDERKHIDMAAGVAIAPAHFPVIALHNLVKELEKKAKEKAYELKADQVSTIDFHRITADGNTALKQARSSDLKPRRYSGREYQKIENGEGGFHKDKPEENVLLIGRPYTIAECRKVLEVAKVWRNEGLPGSKVHQLYEALLESPATVMFAWAKVVGRAKKKDPAHWQQLETLTCELNVRVDCNEPLNPNLAMPWIFLEKQVDNGPGKPETTRQIRKTHLLDVIDMWSMLKSEPDTES